jgi:hypothetical protein
MVQLSLKWVKISGKSLYHKHNLAGRESGMTQRRKTAKRLHKKLRKRRGWRHSVKSDLPRKPIHGKSAIMNMSKLDIGLGQGKILCQDELQ